MRIQITKGGVFGIDGEIAVGTEFDVAIEPNSWAGRCAVIDANSPMPKAKVKRIAVTNPSTDALSGEPDAVSGDDTQSGDAE